MEHRNTIQKELVLSAVRTMRRHVTADEVHGFIAREHPSVSRGTVYRNLNLLSEEKQIRKVRVPNGPEHFDFTLREHYHVRCVKCGSVSDVDMVVLPDLMKMVQDSHGMQFLDYDICFRGVCPECQNRN